MKKTGVALLLAVLLAFLLPLTAYGHASLIKASPEANSQVDRAPERVVLTFNERLEKQLFYLKVVDELGKPVTDKKAELSADQTELSLTLPALSNGTYVVTYHVVSADGHPVDGSHVLTVGPPRGQGALPQGHEHQHELSGSMGLYEYLVFASRIIYYFLLLALTGWVLWMSFFPERGERREAHRMTAVGLQRGFLLSLLVLIFFHYRDLLGEGGLSDIGKLFTGTTIGVTWLLSLILSMLGFVVLLRNRKLDVAWATALLAVKSLNGHANAFEPQFLTLLLDFIHLVGAAIWAGGLLMLVSGWKQADWRERFLPKFSSAALYTLIVLGLTGIIQTLLFLPGLEYLLYSQWGTLLLIKTGLVVLVVLLAGGIRFVWKRRGQERTGTLIKLDLALMIVIVGLVGVLTYVTPIPPNKPLNWHEMGETIHMTTMITPKEPGQDNTLITKIWLPDTMGAPKSVQLKLIPDPTKEIAPITVPLETFNDPDFDGFLGFKRYSYKAVGPYLPFAGNWTIELRVMNPEDDETVYRKEMLLY
ncbi:copper transport protein YcnJ [Paenibacillus sp. J31TS4]|uniref:copper resistance CopC/CopD family protein n=1 Tax=Paenibacillus sp. J31TS4 TaxID=2807195 RepID=UPI001B29E92A|nr:copper resistance protein CopC [Paenibacillus sp. J31TS4]GIP38817.1 copper transport protein YcnJ [Paenibacillus sp. J31TS4]